MNEYGTADIKNYITSLLKMTKRNKWFNIIKPLVYKDYGKFISVYIDKEVMLPFNLNDLQTETFNIEPGFYTHKILGGISYIPDYISLDIRYKDKFNDDNVPFYIVEFGSIIDNSFGYTPDGSSYSYNFGMIRLSNDLAHYSNFEKIEYIPKKGEPLYYIQNYESIKDTNLFLYLAKTKDKFIIGDTSKQSILEELYNQIQ